MAAEISPRVLNMVRRRILEDPAVTNDVLFAAATEMEPDLQRLSMRQFNARYPLRVRRWELSDRTRILHPSGPLSKAAAENPAAPVPPRAQLTLMTDETDGSNAGQSHSATSQSQSRTQTAAPRSETSAATRPTQDAAPSLQARITAPRKPVKPLADAEPPAPTGSQALIPPAETQPATQGESAPPQAEAPELVPQFAPTQRAPRRRRAPRRTVAEDARAEVMTVMLRWATAIGQATAIPEVFATLSTVDDYVDRIATVLDIP